MFQVLLCGFGSQALQCANRWLEGLHDCRLRQARAVPPATPVRASLLGASGVLSTVRLLLETMHPSGTHPRRDRIRVDSRGSHRPHRPPANRCSNAFVRSQSYAKRRRTESNPSRLLPLRGRLHSCRAQCWQSFPNAAWLQSSVRDLPASRPAGLAHWNRAGQLWPDSAQWMSQYRSTLRIDAASQRACRARHRQETQQRQPSLPQPPLRNECARSHLLQAARLPLDCLRPWH